MNLSLQQQIAINQQIDVGVYQTQNLQDSSTCLFQCWMCPGVLPKSFRYFPLIILAILHQGSCGTEKIQCLRGNLFSLSTRV